MLTTKGALYWVYVAYSTVLLLSACGVLLASSRNRRLPFQNALLIAASLLIPLPANLLDQFELTPIHGYDLAPASFVIAGALYAWAILRVRLFDVAPVAHNAVMEAINDLVIVLDTRNQIVDFNRAAEEALSPRSIAPPQTNAAGLGRLFQRTTWSDFLTKKQ
jgi:PAS domain-containing protein